MNDRLTFDRAHGALLGVAIAEAIWSNKTCLIESNAPEKGVRPVNFKQALLSANAPSTRLKFECMDFPLTNIMMGVASSIVDTEQNDLDHQMIQLQAFANRIQYDGLPRTLGKAIKSSETHGISLAGSEDDNDADLYNLSRVVPLAIMYMKASPAAMFSAAMLNSALTHGQGICQDAMKLMSYFVTLNIMRASNYRKDSITTLAPAFSDYIHNMWDKRLVPWAEKDYIMIERQSLPTGNRVEDKMAAMLWCFCNGESPEQSLQLMYDLPQSEDDTATALGALLGSWYGADRMRELLPGIPFWTISKRVSRSLVLLSENESEA